MAESDAPFEYPYEAQAPSKAAELSDRMSLPAKPNWMPLAGTIAFGFLADISILPLMEIFSENDWGAVWVYMSAGVIGSQVAIAAAWLAWTQGPFSFRFVVYWFAVVVALGFWGAGLLSSTGFQLRELGEQELWAILCLLPALALAVQLPLWLTRQYFNWRIVRERDSSITRGGGPLKIRDLMVATVIVSFSMMAARVAAFLAPTEDIWLVLGVLAASVAAISAISVLPIGVWMLKWSNWRLGLVLVSSEAFLAATIPIFVTYALFGFRQRGMVWSFIGLAITIASYVTMLVITALAARGAGYRLHIGRSLSADAEELNRHVASKAMLNPKLDVTQQGGFGRMN